ncbi:heme-binding protein [Salinirubellus sp. GCM10025818]|uniref:heme-binding protein n=1 Tax=Salinirubellus TaxID=2162630 RepID=UPI0030D32AC6
MDSERREPPRTEEGWYVLHDLRRIDWDAWREAPEHERARALESGVDYLAEHEALADVDGEEGASATFSMLGHKADLMVLHLRPTTAALDRAERRFEATPFAGFTERVSSYVSVTEISGYLSEEVGEGIENVEDTGTRNYLASRLYPTLPDAEHVCFYPMDKRRDPEYNWYDLPFEERAELISGHGEIGREYAGKVTQIISGSVGFDDYEWGVTLFADDPTEIKHLLYEMRFDPSSSRYAEFGPFYFGRRFAPGDLPALLAGETVPADDGGTDAEATEHGDEEATHARAAAVGGSGHGHGHDGADGGDHGHGSSGDGAADDRPDGTSGGDSGGGRPSRPAEPPHEEVDPEELARELGSVGIDLDDHPETGYILLFTTTEDAEELAEEVDGLRSNFEHYDTHVLTAVRADAGRSVVASLWKNERAANTASGFLSDLPGAEDGRGAAIERASDDEDESESAAGDGHGDDQRDGSGDGDQDLRDELESLGVYGGQPHGEDVHAVVIYSEADVEELGEAVEDLRGGFDRYDTHRSTATYEAEDGSRAAVASIWETGDAAETAAGYLSDLPGVVERAGEESGFGTMGMFYTVKPDYREEFVETFGEVGEILEGMDGHLETSLLVNRENENDMFIASQWNSREDAMAFFRSDEFRETVEWGREVLADRPRHVFLE